MNLQHSDCFLYLGFECLLIFEHVQQLRILNLQQHARDFASQCGMHTFNHRIQTLAKDLFLFLWLGISQQRGNELLLVCKHAQK